MVKANAYNRTGKKLISRRGWNVIEGCKSYTRGNPIDGMDYDCEYEFSGQIDCEDCIFGSCGGQKDPREKPKEEEED